jgi:cytoskeleton protein RodZ
VTIGQRLREARLRRELDIADAEAYTKIRAKYLRALENDEFGILPDQTLVKTFLRTYGDYLGLDTQLLLEEYRAQHEPRGQGDIPPLAPRRTREPRRRGPLIGPGGAFAIGIVLLLVLFAVLGLTGGDDEGGGGGGDTTRASDERTDEERREARERRERRERREARERRQRRALTVRVTPAGPTYVCVDDGRRTTFEGTISSARTFRGRRGGRLRINLGRTVERLTVNGRRVRVPESSTGAGFAFSRTGRATPLPAAQRPCA